MSTQAVAIGGQPADQHALANAGTAAIGPSVGQPSNKLQTRMPTVIDGVLGLRLRERIGCIGEEDLLLLRQRQIGPHHADEHIDERDDLRSGEPAETIKLSDASLLPAQQCSLHPEGCRMRRAIATVRNVGSAPRTGARQEGR